MVKKTSGEEHEPVEMTPYARNRQREAGKQGAGKKARAAIDQSAAGKQTALRAAQRSMGNRRRPGKARKS